MSRDDDVKQRDEAVISVTATDAHDDRPQSLGNLASHNVSFTDLETTQAAEFFGFRNSPSWTQQELSEGEGNAQGAYAPSCGDEADQEEDSVANVVNAQQEPDTSGSSSDDQAASAQTKRSSSQGGASRSRPLEARRARRAQFEWRAELVRIEEQWRERGVSEHNPHFVKQYEEAKKNWRAQKTCLLLKMQMAAKDNVIAAEIDEQSSAWRGFRVLNASAFRMSFDSTRTHRGFVAMWRRFGLVAEGKKWEEAFVGNVSFVRKD